MAMRISMRAILLGKDKKEGNMEGKWNQKKTGKISFRRGFLLVVSLAVSLVLQGCMGVSTLKENHEVTIDYAYIAYNRQGEMYLDYHFLQRSDSHSSKSYYDSKFVVRQAISSQNFVFDDRLFILSYNGTICAPGTLLTGELEPVHIDTSFNHVFNNTHFFRFSPDQPETVPVYNVQEVITQEIILGTGQFVEDEDSNYVYIEAEYSDGSEIRNHGPYLVNYLAYSLSLSGQRFGNARLFDGLKLSALDRDHYPGDLQLTVDPNYELGYHFVPSDGDPFSSVLYRYIYGGSQESVLFIQEPIGQFYVELVDLDNLEIEIVFPHLLQQKEFPILTTRWTYSLPQGVVDTNGDGYYDLCPFPVYTTQSNPRGEMTYYLQVKERYGNAYYIDLDGNRLTGENIYLTVLNGQTIALSDQAILGLQ